MQFGQKGLDAPPEDAHIMGLAEVALEVAPGSLRLQGQALLRVDLGCDVRMLFESAPPFLTHDAVEQHAEVPVLHAKTQEQQSTVRECRPDDLGYRVGVPAGRAQELEIVVLTQDHGSRLLQAAEDVED